MKSTIIILQSNNTISESLAASLSILFDEVSKVESVAELRRHDALHSATALIVDLERMSLSEVKDLSHDVPDVRIVCVHRLADESLWNAALNAGASDCCPSNDTRSIVNAARGLRAMVHSIAA